ncbi:hypothetical protein ALI22I_43615 [Saccharothrix sp. ALI-22-I]|uniref:hypothetical protein n=1 Tax=Saccharothrix sp. ALI-22-I TaxID=1933778 RepID=UPI0009C66A76|nr:hypothetical protein [Saccharothrix sp. ALI-22-I]ONI80262.1 hypothetical protein ALI22I_43615 [Saccharothrix sp. ALI-22-I]
MSDSARLPARSVVVVLFAVAACAVLAAGGLTAVVLADSRPGPVTPVVAGERPSPTARTAATRAVAHPMCLIGSWRTVDETLMVKFYNDEDPMPLTTSGRVFEFRPDGTGTERLDNVTLSGSFEGNALRMVGNGSTDFTWSATDKVITYIDRTRTDVTWAFYDQRGLVDTQPVTAKQGVNEVDDYSCQGTQLVESNGSGYRSVWARTTASGVYG